MKKGGQSVGVLAGYSRVGLGGLRRSGVLRSLFSGRPVDGAGRPIPWWTYAAIEAVGDALRPGDRVVEFGSGHSTLWFAGRVAAVTAVENDPGWADVVEGELAAAGASASGAEVLRAERFDAGRFRPYLEAADVVVIDGAWRREVAELAGASAKRARLVVADNTEREEERELPDLLRRMLGGHLVRFRSMGPCLLQVWETALLYTRFRDVGAAD